MENPNTHNPLVTGSNPVRPTNKFNLEVFHKPLCAADSTFFYLILEVGEVAPADGARKPVW
jgi:hypothetical protein